jgi:hypothetical protein
LIPGAREKLDRKWNPENSYPEPIQVLQVRSLRRIGITQLREFGKLAP